jgi:hypothetical protein
MDNPQTVESLAGAPTPEQDYDVHAYAVVRIKVAGVRATSQLAAIEKVEAQLRPSEHCDREIGVDVEGLGTVEYAEYAEEFVNMLVDEHGDPQHERSTPYLVANGDWTPVYDTGLYGTPPSSLDGGLKPRHIRLQHPTITTSKAFREEHPWCGWIMAFAHWSESDTVTAYGFSERLKNMNVLLTTADGRSRPVSIRDFAVDMPSEDDELCHRGIAVNELDTDQYEPLTPEIRELVRYEDIREIVVY